MSSIPVSLIPAMAEVVAGVAAGSKVQYVDDSGEVREAHLRGFNGSGADAGEAVIRLSDWTAEWQMSLMDAATRRQNGELRIL